MTATAKTKAGTTGNDKIIALPGDIVDGGAGNDTITGAIGATMRGGTGSDKLIFSAEGQKQAIKLSLAEQLKSDTTLLPKTTISGFEHFDFTFGNGADTLDARGASFHIGDVTTTVPDIFQAGAGIDTLLLDYKMSGNLYAAEFETIFVDLSGLTTSAEFSGGALKFNNFNGSIWDAVNVTIKGGSGNDYLIPYIQEPGTVKIYGGAGNDQIGALTSDGDRTLDGAIFDGGAGNDTMGGYEGATMRGGAGLDHLGLTLDTKNDIHLRLTDQLVEEVTLFGDTKISGFEHFDLDLGRGNDILDIRGMHFGTKFYSGATAINTLNKFWGSLGTDTILVDSSVSGQITIDFFEKMKADFSDLATPVVVTYGEIKFADSLITGNDVALNIIGGRAADTIEAGHGNDKLNGAGGADILRGGGGDDTYVIDASDDIYEYGFDGIDTVQISTSYRLLENFENLTLTGKGSITGEGNSLDNVIIGNSGDNILDGREGLDTLIGGAGNDTYWIDALQDTIIDSSGIDKILATANCSLEVYKDIENLTLAGDGNLNGTGNSFANRILGNSGNNVLDGKLGADFLEGGAGNDRYVLGAEYDTIIDISGRDMITSTISRSLASYKTIENLRLEGIQNLNAAGNDLDNSIQGNAGNNVLDGGRGNDVLTGGYGNDTYILGAESDVVSDEDGIDTITSTITRNLDNYWTIENLKLLGSSNINGSGNHLNNSIWGNAANNRLIGGDGADRLNGGDGNDILTGGTGSDLLVGGKGLDSFQFDTKLGSTNIDLIDDFDIREDVIQLKSRYFSEAGLVGKLADKAFWSGTKAHDTDDRIIYDKATGKLFYDADGSGAKSAIQFATLDKNLSLSFADFDILA